MQNSRTDRECTLIMTTDGREGSSMGRTFPQLCVPASHYHLAEFQNLGENSLFVFLISLWKVHLKFFIYLDGTLNKDGIIIYDKISFLS